MFFGMLQICNFLDIFVICSQSQAGRGFARFSRFDLLQICQVLKVFLVLFRPGRWLESFIFLFFATFIHVISRDIGDPEILTLARRLLYVFSSLHFRKSNQSSP